MEDFETGKKTELHPPLDINNSDSVENWLQWRVKRPDDSYLDTKDESGQPVSEEQRFELTKQQIRNMVHDYKEMGFSEDQIKQTLVDITEPLSEPEDKGKS